MAEVKVSVGSTYTAQVEAGLHHFAVDEPIASGGHDEGPNPEQLLASALGCCMAITLRMYANRKNWPLENINVTVTFNREKESKDSLKAKVELLGPLTAEMKSRLIEIAAKCPMHKTLSAGLEIRIA